MTDKKYDLNTMELDDTIELMKSDDHEDRLLAEYLQVCIRIRKLQKFQTDWRNGRLSFTPNNQYINSVAQVVAMESYRAALEVRMMEKGMLDWEE